MLEPQSRRSDTAMRHIDGADSHVANREHVVQQGDRGGRRIATATVENVAEAPVERFTAALACIARHRLTPQVKDLPQIVDAMNMIGMLMRQDSRIDIADAGFE